MIERIRPLLTPWRVLVAVLLTAAAVIVTVRFAFGLGSVTNLSDETPWGIWVGFDILAGIGLAAGGFIMAVGGVRLRSSSGIARWCGCPFSPR